MVGVNDEIAAAVKRARPRLNVYGIDGLPEAAGPGIVSIRQPVQATAGAAVAMLAVQHERGVASARAEEAVQGNAGGEAVRQTTGRGAGTFSCDAVRRETERPSSSRLGTDRRPTTLRSAGADRGA